MAWGLVSAIPENAIAAWGARCIADPGDRIGVVWDRQASFAVNDEALELLKREVERNNETGVLQDSYARNRKAGRLRNDEAGQVTLFDRGCRVRCAADTRGSFGYVYVAMWILPEPYDAGNRA
jgi:hypothetical protein